MVNGEICMIIQMLHMCLTFLCKCVIIIDDVTFVTPFASLENQLRHGQIAQGGKKMNIKKVIAFIMVQLMDISLWGLIQHPEVCPRIVDNQVVIANIGIRYGLYFIIVVIWIWSAMVLTKGKRRRTTEDETEDTLKEEDKLQ